MFNVFLSLFFGLFLISLSPTKSHAKNNLHKTKSKPISALILFYGDYKSEVQFDGFIQDKITGLLNENKEFKAHSECEISAKFNEVFYLKSPHLKIQFFATCESLNADQNTKYKEDIVLSPEYVRLKDLKTESSGFYLSKAFKNVQFKIKDLKY